MHTYVELPESCHEEISREMDPFEEEWLSSDMTWGFPVELGINGHMTLHWSQTSQGLCDATSAFPLLKPQTSPPFCHSLHHVEREETIVMLKATV